ncbi:ATPase [Prolixibacteraceae bacterium JC049]|nr:ATPase [Prolixibacteraceae bacterium JC049]
MTLNNLKYSNQKLLLFGGKGGVGKTSCATATAISLAQKYRTLLISADPAHSLSDSLEQTIGYNIKNIEGVNQLSALEIAADTAFETFKEEHRNELIQLLDTSSHLDKEDIDQLMQLTIPGIDEIMSFKIVIDLIEQNDFEKYVLDTAPTGHVLRLLSSPKLLDAWIKVAARLRWKYRYFISRFSGNYQPDDTDNLLITLKKTVKRIEKLLKDPESCEFIPVTLPEAMAMNETQRLIGNLKKHDISIRHLVVNHVMKSGSCLYCIRKKNSQLPYLNTISEQYNSKYKVVYLSSSPIEIKGINSLRQMGEDLFSSNHSEY